MSYHGPIIPDIRSLAVNGVVLSCFHLFDDPLFENSDCVH